jgi:hypothetical protein
MKRNTGDSIAYLVAGVILALCAIAGAPAWGQSVPSGGSEHVQLRQASDVVAGATVSCCREESSGGWDAGRGPG